MLMKVVKALRVVKGSRMRYLWNLGLQLTVGKGTTWMIRGEKYRFLDEGIATLVIYKEIRAGTYDPIIPLRNGDVVLDIGAHVGMFSIPLAREHPDVQFICVEPDLVNYSNLNRNVYASGVKNIKVVWAAVGPEGHVGTHHNHFNSGATQTTEYGRIPQHPLKWFGPCRLLKMDVEGAEYQAIGSRADLADAESVIIEVHRNERQDDMVKLCEGARIIKE